MTTPSGWGQSGISFNVAESIIRGGADLFQVTWKLLAYSHTLSDLIGFDTAMASFAVQETDIDEWVEQGLLRDITVYLEDQSVIFNGFVNRITVNIGRYNMTVGPVTEIANDVAVVYSTVDTSISPPAVGVRTKTDSATDADSQTQWGVLQRVDSIGGATTVEAEALRDTILQEVKDPPVSRRVSASPGGFSMQLEIAGYYHLLQTYIYNQTTTGGDIDLSANVAPLGKLQEVLQADPNSYISTDYSQVAANTLQVPAWEDEDRKASQVIQNLLKLGISSGSPVTFGVYADRRVSYADVGDSFTYSMRVRENRQRVFDYNSQAEIPLALVRPGKWAFVTDMLIGKAPPSSDIEEDLRSILIDTVRFTVPDGIDITGRNASTASQQMARISMGGA